MIALLRWPIILILLALVAGSLFPAVIGTIETYNLPVDLSPIGGLSDELKELAASTSMLERILWYAAGVFFFIAAVRLIRRTQAFWLWLLGFASYGARWALTVQDQGGLVQAAASLSAESFQPDQLTAASPAAQSLLLGGHLLVGLIILVIDAADRRYWDSQAA